MALWHNDMWDIFIFYLAPHDQFPRMMAHAGYTYIPSGISWSISKDYDTCGIYLYSIWHLMINSQAWWHMQDIFIYSIWHLMIHIQGLWHMCDIFILYLAPHDKYPRKMTHVWYAYIPSGTSWSISKYDDTGGIYIYSIWHLMINIQGWWHM